jgi:hypothetical protein
MRKIHVILLAVFTTGVLCGGIGTGIAFGEYSSMEYGGTVMLGEEYQKMNTGSGFPVNRAAFDSQDETDGEMSMGTGWKVGGKDMQFSYGYPTEAVTTRVKELAQKAEISLEGNVVLEEAVVEFGVQVLTGSMSVEQAVKEIQQKTAIYLSE